MKKTFSIFALAAAVLCSCNKEADYTPTPSQEPQERGRLSISLNFADPATKALEAFTESQNYEMAVNNVQVFVFEESGKLNIYKDAGTAKDDIEINTTAGKKTVWAVVNGPDLSSVKGLTDLTAKAVDLAANSTDAAKGFLMAGSAECTVSAAADAEAPVSVSRLASRVALKTIVNNIPEGYGPMTIDYVMLSNVVGNQDISGNATISTWYNKMGRKDGGAQADIINGTSNLASCPELTFKAPGTSIAHGAADTPAVPYLLYCYPNPTTTDKTGWSASFTPRKTRLVVAATIAGTRYYYPVIIDTPERNKTYTVGLTLTGLGSTDPDVLVEKGKLTVSVSVESWQTGSTYEETI